VIPSLHSSLVIQNIIYLRALPWVRFAIINTIKSTGYSPFQLKHGRSPRVLPPLIDAPPKASRENISAREAIARITTDVADARDELMVAKIAQAYQANQHRRDNPEINVGDLVMLSTLNRKKEHSEKRVAKFMAQFDGPYQITNVRSDQLKLNAPANAAFYFYLFAKE